MKVWYHTKCTLMVDSRIGTDRIQHEDMTTEDLSKYQRVLHVNVPLCLEQEINNEGHYHKAMELIHGSARQCAKHNFGIGEEQAANAIVIVDTLSLIGKDEESERDIMVRPADPMGIRAVSIVVGSRRNKPPLYAHLSHGEEVYPTVLTWVESLDNATPMDYQCMVDEAMKMTSARTQSDVYMVEAVPYMMLLQEKKPEKEG